MTSPPVGPLWPGVATAISAASGTPFHFERQAPCGGGCINRAAVLEGCDQRYFVKINRADKLFMFEAEAEGLLEIASSGAIRVPHPICWGKVGAEAYLVLEHLELRSCDGNCAERMGRHLAAMHRHYAPCHGWRRDNTIGSTPQSNTEECDWPTFWRDHRLGYQLRLAARNGFRGALLRHGEHLLDALPQFFSSYAPRPSLLHGDLWGGNAAAGAAGEPVIFDPAVYYGDRETDLAMTELFGGFPPRFDAAYREAWPLDPGYGVRKNLYNLYHVLNHANLFGGAYPAQAERMMARLLSEFE